MAQKGGKMIIPTDMYPGVGYVDYPQQQGYAMHQQSQYLTNVYYSHVSGTQMVPIPYTTSPQYPKRHGTVRGGHNQKQEGWKETNKHQDGWYSGGGHCGVGYDSNDQKHEGWKEMNKHQDGCYDGSGHHSLGYESNDPSKFSRVPLVPSKYEAACATPAMVPRKYEAACTAKCEVPSNRYGLYEDQVVPSKGYGPHTNGPHTNGPLATRGSGTTYLRNGSQTMEYCDC